MDINWKKGNTPISQLNLDNFYSFANSFAEYTYLRAYKAALAEAKAAEISIQALARVICRESAEADSNSVMPEEGIDRALRGCLSKEQLARLYSDENIVTNENLPHASVIDFIVEKAVAKADKEMPRYAPVFSGTLGMTEILGIVACLIAAIALIWISPVSKLSERTSSGEASKAISAARDINSELLVEAHMSVNFEDDYGIAFNSGSVPVLVDIDGPDAGAVRDITVYDDENQKITLYQYDKKSYCYFADKESVYTAEILSEKGESVSSYAYVSGIKEASGSDAAASPSIVVAHSQSKEILFEKNVTVASAPKKCTYDVSGKTVTITPNGKSKSIGIDSMTVTLSSGEKLIIPILIYNNAPKVQASSLSNPIKHTPSHPGAFAGKIDAFDADEDKLLYTFKESKNCSVFLAPNGSFIAGIDKDCSETQASFSFTVSDGRITSDKITMVFELENSLIDERDFSQKLVCYAGEKGWYTLDLPSYDNDGDSLKWALAAPLEGGKTKNGSEVSVSSDGSVVKYRIDPKVDYNFVEALELVCSDGWLQSDVITFECIVAPNMPPAAANGNRTSMTMADGSVTCSMKINDDCPFDRCVITGISEAVGGTVTPNEGWDELQFTFTPDGTEYDCYVLVQVSDTITDAVSVIQYVIKIV